MSFSIFLKKTFFKNKFKIYINVLNIKYIKHQKLLNIQKIFYIKTFKFFYIQKHLNNLENKKNIQACTFIIIIIKNNNITLYFLIL